MKRFFKLYWEISKERGSIARKASLKQHSKSVGFVNKITNLKNFVPHSFIFQLQRTKAWFLFNLQQSFEPQKLVFYKKKFFSFVTDYPSTSKERSVKKIFVQKWFALKNKNDLFEKPISQKSTTQFKIGFGFKKICFYFGSFIFFFWSSSNVLTWYKMSLM
jgi:hypothetical protein